MKTITTIGQAKDAKPGSYPVKGAVGVVFRKTADTPGARAFNQRLSVRGQRRWMSFGVLKRFTTLAEVCTKSRKVLSARDEGEDPIEARRDKKGSARVRAAGHFDKRPRPTTRWSGRP